jgi:pilus assembly protein CpaE
MTDATVVVPEDAGLASDTQVKASVVLTPVLREPTDRPHKRQLSTRHRRPAVIAFVADAASERAVSEGLADVLPDGVDVRRGGIRGAIVAMRKNTTPGVLIVDLSGEDQPLTALAELADVVEPDVCVLVIGDVDSVDFYREVTHNLGAQDYLPKPLTSDKVAQLFGGIVAGRAPTADGVQGGGLLIVSGVSGGVGATTLAVNLAGHFGVSLNRHTVILDPDLHLGDVSLLLNVKAGSGLRTALEAPDRIDALLAERAAQPAAERLHVLAGDEALNTKLNNSYGAGASLILALRRRYNLIIADVSFRVPLYDELLELPHQRILVTLPTLGSVRATLRHLAAVPKAEQAKRPVIVLNRLGTPGSLTRAEVEEALGVKVEVVIPDQPRQVAAAATMGELAMLTKGSFRNGILELASHVSFVGLQDARPSARVTKWDRGGYRGWNPFRRKL